MYGTQKIKDLLSGVLSITTQLAKVLEDGKISLFELPALAMASTAIPGMVENAKGALEELKDLDAKETKEVKDYIKDNFSISNKDLEAKIEEAIDLLEGTYVLAVDGWQLFGKWKGWAATL